MKTFYIRTFSAIVFGTVMIAGFWYSVATFLLLIFIINFVCLFEYFSLIQKIPSLNYRFFDVIAGISIGVFFNVLMIALLSYQSSLNALGGIFIMLPVLALLFFIFQVFKKEYYNLQPVAFSTLGLLYITVPLNLMVFMGAGNDPFGSNPTLNYDIIFGILVLIWVGDTMAYITGSLLGKKKLIENISPNKTIAGTIGGIIFCVIASIIISKYFSHKYSLIDWVTIGLIAGIFGTFGDLVESLLKRTAGVKDSGRIMPGHGGLLDRFDSFIFVIPFVFVYLYLSGKLLLA
jgi:phosphatidate cytidylyltransferase